jgi:cell wall-associated NlpC family hydrolase
LPTLRTGARAFIPAVLAGAILIGLAPSTPVAAADPTTEAQQIVRIARAQVGDPWRYGASGPSAFDCSGLVIYAYKKAGDGRAIRAGTLRSARSIYYYFKSRGLASRSNPKIGDLVIWGSGTHIGIYVGNGRAVSTLRNGVRVHGVFAVTARFTAYLHTGMSKRAYRP